MFGVRALSVSSAGRRNQLSSLLLAFAAWGLGSYGLLRGLGGRELTLRRFGCASLLPLRLRRVREGACKGNFCFGVIELS